MRVIAGEARGVPLVAPRGSGTRPTTDRLKAAIFSALGELGCTGIVADLFAGSGALGIEALSRGAARCDFVESAAWACRAIRINLEKTKLAARARVFCQPVERFVAAGGAGDGAPYDLILIDPPYAFAGLDGLLEALGASSLVGARAALLLEHAARRAAPERVGPLARARTRAHGDGAFSLYLGS